MVSTKLYLPILIRKNQSLKTKLQESFTFCQKANNEKKYIVRVLEANKTWDDRSNI